MSLQGVIPIVVTPFDEHGRIDTEGLRREVDRLVEGGARVLGIGLASEIFSMTEHERRELTATLVAAVDGRAGILAGAGADDVDLAVERSRAALDAGADYLLVTPPRPDPGEDGVFRYYAALSEAVPAPIVIQDAQAITEVALPPELIARMGREIEHVAYAKIETRPTPQKFAEIVALAGNSLKLIGGMGGTYCIDEFRRGSVGTMPGPGSAILYLFQVWESLTAGQEEAAMSIFYRHLPLLHWGLEPGRFLHMEKELLRRMGVIPSSAYRPPVPPVQGLEREEFEKVLELVGVVFGERRP
jgi:4-hydroxy-tetrahydrodipicolinate synthase